MNFNIRQNFEYNKALAGRFISDYKLPVPTIIDADHFYHYIFLLQKDYGALEKYNKLCDYIHDNYNDDPNLFLEYYYNVRENIITTMANRKEYIEFNNMDMKKFNIPKNNISTNNIYNGGNINKFFISIDMKKANFQALKYVNKNILFGADTYEEFISNFTDCYYIKESKYTRQVIFGQLNPKRHITVEKYITSNIFSYIENHEKLKEYKDKYKCVSLCNDEIVYEIDSMNVKEIYYVINDILKEYNKIDLSITAFMLSGYQLYIKNSSKPKVTFFEKINLYKDGNLNNDTKLVSVPLPFFPIIYKLKNNLELEPFDYHINYEDILAELKADFYIKSL